MRLTTEKHAEIFKGYLNRVSLGHVRQILDAVEGCWHEQLNGNAGSQDHAAKKLDDAVRKSLATALPSDLGNIETITRKQYDNVI